MEDLEITTAIWCQKGFCGTCISSTVLGKHCFLMDVVVTDLSDTPNASIINKDSSHSTAISTSSGIATRSVPTLHLVGEHTIRDAPRTIRGFIAERFGTPLKTHTIAPATSSSAISETQNNSNNNGTNGLNASDIIGDLFVVSIYFGRNEHSLSPAAFEALAASLRASDDIAGTPPCPRVGDVLLFPPNACFSRANEKTCFPTRSVLGKTIPVLNARDGVEVAGRGEPHRPADYADKWQVEKKIRGTEDSNQIGQSGAKAHKNNKNVAKPQDNKQKGNDSSQSKYSPNHEGRSGHGARFNIVANWLAKTFCLPSNNINNNIAGSLQQQITPTDNNRPVRILDVAGGGGRLSCELALMGYHCTVVDPRSVDDNKLSVIMDLTIRQHKHREVTQKYFADVSSGKEPEDTQRHLTNSFRPAPKRNRSEDGDEAVGAETNDKECDEANIIDNNAGAKKCENAENINVIKVNALQRITFCRALFDAKDMRASGFDFHALVSQADLIVGLHCDGAVNAIIEAAAQYQKHFAIIPCCVFPSLFSRRLCVEEGADKLTTSGDEVLQNSNPNLHTPKSILCQEPTNTAGDSSEFVAVIDRSQLVRWIPQEARRLGFQGELHICTPARLVGANECAYGIASL